MERIDCPEVLAGLVRGQLKRGVFTNQPLTCDYRAWVADGAAAEPFDGGLWLLRRRGGHDRLTFFLQPGAPVSPPGLARPAVTEIPFREKNAAEAADAVARLEAAGFRTVLRRVRRSRPAGPEPGGTEGVAFPGPALAGAVGAFLAAEFSERTGCLPTAAELAAALGRGEVAWLADGGVLHFAPGRGSWEIRHLALAPDLRGRGLAGRLLRACLAANGQARSVVWAAADNAPAGRFYEKHGYRPDGWQSAVLEAGERTTP